MTHEIGDQLEFCMGILGNLSGFFEKADVAVKQQIIGPIFIGNLIFFRKQSSNHKSERGRFAIYQLQ
jgi:hypothetical protein